jgi:hypothetical protein
MRFRFEDEIQFSKRQQIVTLILAVLLFTAYLLNIVLKTDTDLKINGLWTFFFPIQIMVTLYSAWRYTTQSRNLLLLQSALLLLSWMTRYSTILDPYSFMTNSYFIYDLTGRFEIGIAFDEILYTILSVIAIGLSIWPGLKRRLLKKPVLASIS